MKQKSHQETAPLTTVEPVARYLGVSEARVYELCREELIPHTRIGRSIRFSPAAVMRWAKSGGSTYPGGWRKGAVR